MNNLSNKHHGFTLIELIVFMSVLSFVSVSTFVVFDNVLSFNGEPNQALKAAALARSRMEIVLLNREKGYDTLSDPCEASSPPAACTALSNYATARQLSVTSTITESAPNKTINISVSPSTGSGNTHSLSSRVTDYD